MPTPQLKALASRHGVSLSVAERYWREAKEQYDGNYQAVVGTVKKRLMNRAKSRRKALAD